MAVCTPRSRITEFSLPAERSASLVLRRFIRDIARGTSLGADEITGLQVAAADAFDKALAEQRQAGEGRIALRIHADADGIEVNLTYRETHFPPAEFFSRS